MGVITKVVGQVSICKECGRESEAYFANDDGPYCVDCVDAIDDETDS